MKADDARKLPLDENLILSKETGGLFEYIRNLVKALTGNYNHLANIININDDNTTTNTTNIAITGAGHISILPWAYSSITQGNFAFNTDANQWGGFFMFNNTSVSGDRINYSVYLVIGTYTFNILHVKATNFGIINVSLDGYSTSEGTIDFYGSTTYNVSSSITGITVAATGLYTLSLKSDTKHSSSSNYGIGFSTITLFRTT